MPFTRRAFVSASSAALLGAKLHAQSRTEITRPNVAVIDRVRILAAAREALAKPPNPQALTHNSAALLELTLLVPALAAGVGVARDNDPTLVDRFQTHAAAHLEAWFVSQSTRIGPALPPKTLQRQTEEPNPEAILETTGLAEVAVAIPFLGIEAARYRTWFAAFLKWLIEDRTALLARDSKDRLGASWLLQTSAYARFTNDEATLTELRHRFKTVTIRAQIDSTGIFHHELTTANPYRNSLFALDLLAGASVLLTTRFDSLWNCELQDGPGLRSAIARHVPYIESRGTWPYPSDETHFKDLPCRRPAVLFAARAYSSPEYAVLWRGLAPAQPSDPELLRTFPIRQPLLWTTQPKII